ncbi:MAG: excinuclease ABC subunit A, partial [Coprobacillus sp.]
KHNLYLIDEPTIGLHPIDVERLLVLFERIVDQGNTLIVIEHNTQVIKQADWVVDMGPGGGISGGKVIACG